MHAGNKHKQSWQVPTAAPHSMVNITSKDLKSGWSWVTRQDSGFIEYAWPSFCNRKVCLCAYALCLPHHLTTQHYLLSGSWILFGPACPLDCTRISLKAIVQWMVWACCRFLLASCWSTRFHFTENVKYARSSNVSINIVDSQSDTGNIQVTDATKCSRFSTRSLWDPSLRRACIND